VHVPESEQPAVWAYGIAPFLAAGSLAAFGHGSALYSGAVDPDPNLDVVLVRGRDRSAAEESCRIAVHRDATGRALERAASFARVVFGASKIGTTTLDAEVRADLLELVEKVGGLPALLAEWDRVLANPSHEPDQATLTYYERLRAAVVSGERESSVLINPAKAPGAVKPRANFPRVFMARKRGAA
jgi:ketol-acid reductoisomerase